MNMNFSKLQGGLIAVLLLLAVFIYGDRVTTLMNSKSETATVVSCKSKVVKSSYSKSSRRKTKWSYAPVAVSETGNKAIGTKSVRKKWCNQLLSRQVTIFVNENPAKNRINSFFQYWLLPTAMLFAVLFIAALSKPVICVAIFFSFFAFSGAMVFHEFGLTDGLLGERKVSAPKRSSTALNACIKKAMQREEVNRESDLKKLVCVNAGIIDLSPLKDFTRLEVLSLKSNNLTSLEALQPLKALRKLSIQGNKQINSLNGLEMMAALEELRAYRMQLTDIEALRNLNALRVLDVSGNQIDNISALRELEHIETINLNKNPISNLEPLQNKQSLKELYFLQSYVTDITPLFENTNLKTVGAITKGPVSCDQIRQLRAKLARDAKISAQKTCN